MAMALGATACSPARVAAVRADRVTKAVCGRALHTVVVGGPAGAASVPELREDDGPLGVNSRDDGLPGLCLLCGVESRGVGVAVADARRADAGRLSDEQLTGVCALRVVERGVRLRDGAGAAAAGERRIRSTRLQLEGAHLNVLEERRDGVWRRDLLQRGVFGDGHGARGAGAHLRACTRCE